MRGFWCAFVVAVACVVSGCEGCDNSFDEDPVDAKGTGVCTSNDTCVGDDVCIAGACKPPGSVMVGGMCFATRDCAMGLNCSELGMCVMAGTGMVGDTCQSVASCAAGLACVHDGFGGTCATPGTIDLGGTCAVTTDCIAGLACGNADTCEPIALAYPPFAGVMCEPDSQTFGPYFEVPRTGTPLKDFYRLPFPNDIRVRANGTLDLSDFPRPGKSLLGVDIVDLYATALEADFEGFSSVAPMTFRFTSELDFDSLGSNGANIHIADLTAGTEVGRRGFSYGTGKTKFSCQQQLLLGNDRSQPLQMGHIYAGYMTTAIRGKNGQVPVVPPDMVAMLAPAPPSDPDLAAAYAKYAPFRGYLTNNSIDPATIAVAAVFTVGNHSARTTQLAAAVEASALPTLKDLTLCDGVNVSPCAGEDDRACGDSSGSFWEIHGKFSEPNFQAGTLPYATVADGGAITFNGATPVEQGTQDVCFALTIPKTTAPGGGWPLVVHAHGTGGSFKAAVNGGTTSIAHHLATASTPMATLTFDGVVHGARHNNSPRSVDSLVFNLINPRAARDNHLQGAVDVIQALRVAQVAPFTVAPGTGTLSGIAFDAGKTYYFGHSQGSNVGIPAIAVTDLAQGALFSGAGSDLALGIVTKTSPVDAKAGLQLLLGDNMSAGHPVLVLFQTLFERADPINYTRLLIVAPPAGVASKHVMQTWSATDTYSPKDTLDSTAKSAGLLTAEPVLAPLTTADPRPVTTNKTGGDGPMRLGAVFQYATDGTYDGHFVAQRNPQAITDWLAFFASLAAGAPSVP